MGATIRTGLSLLLVAGVAVAQEDSDALFAKARSLPRDQREQARALCLQVLQRSPGYQDVRLYLARLYAWDGRYDEARQNLKQVLAAEPGNLEAREAAIDVEVWADAPGAALRLCDEGLALAPGSAELHYRKARLQKNAGDPEGALRSDQTALALDPDHQPARLLRDDLKEQLMRWQVSESYTYDSFDQIYQPWQTWATSLRYHFDAGSVILRVTRARMFDSWGTQEELDAYPRIGDGTYAYLNAGRSSDSIFPSSRCGAELFHNFIGGWEGSLGFRYLNFSSSSVTMYTGSVSKYRGDWMFTGRSYVTPSQAGTSVSGSLAARYYMDDADSYLSASISGGVDPEQPVWSASVFQLQDRKATVAAQKKLLRSWIASAGLGLERREFEPAVYVVDTSFTLGLAKRF